MRNRAAIRSLEETRKGQLEIAQERNEIKANVQKLEKEVEKQLQIIQVHEQQEATLLKVPHCWPAERKYVNLIKG
jgi:hypothetical protein